MKYVILRIPRADPFTERASATGGRGETPYKLESADLDDRHIADVREDPTVEEMAPSIVLSLIEPLADQAGSAKVQSAWGIEAVGAGNSPYNGAGVTVAVLDTGIDKEHKAFSGLPLEPGDLMDFVDHEEGTPGAAPDTHGHGTHVAGTIFGREVDGTRIGVAPGVTRALIGKVIGLKGARTETLTNAIEWAARRRADIICMSLGINFPGLVTELVQDGLPEDIAASRALEAYRSNMRLLDRLAELVDARVARGRGSLLLAASGNASRRLEDARFTVAVGPPAAADKIVAVGAIAASGEVAPFSNTGCTLVAPGVDILSAKAGGGLRTSSGTSMAAPHVAGVMALWAQKLFPTGKRPPDWAKDVQGAIESSVKRIAGASRSDVGRGLVQAPQE